MKVLFSFLRHYTNLLRRYSNLLLISKNKNVEYARVPSFRRPKETPATATTIPPWHPPVLSLLGISSQP